MNNPENIAIDPKDMVLWLAAYRNERAASWTMLEKESGIPASTLSAFTNQTYLGNLENLAKRVYRFKQKVESQSERRRSELLAPRFVETPTARLLLSMLEIAQMGRITAAAMGPGTGKTKTGEFFCDSVANAWMVTMRHSHRTVPAMIHQIMLALGLTENSNWVGVRSNRVATFLRERPGALLVVDEANHLTLEGMEELRGLHDVTGAGICLFGNDELARRIRGGTKSHAYARLNSRIAQMVEQDSPTIEDIEVYLDAMDVTDSDMRKPLVELGQAAASGGLREIQQVLEMANILAIGREEVMGLPHIQRAVQNRYTRRLRRAA